jgi:o-succinylbenzoate---CoA ligase
VFIIPHWLDKRAFLTPNKKAIHLKNGISYTFSELRDDAIRFAKQLYGAGIKKGAHIALLSNNCYEMVVAIHALSYLQAKIVLLNTRLTTNELLFQYEDSESSNLLYDDSIKERHRDFIEKTDSLSFQEVNLKSPITFPYTGEMNLNEPFTIMYTSGTTGFPKGVLHSYGNHFWSATSSVLNLGLEKDDSWLAAVPLFHVSGFSILVRSVLYGIPVYLHEKFVAKDVAKQMKVQGVTTVSVVTVMLEELLREFGNHPPDSLRCMLLGGGPAPKGLLEKCKVKNIPVFQTYGMTETSSQIVTISPNDALRKLGSAGKPLFTAQLKIMDDEKELPAYKVGEIVVKGPMVTQGYFKREDVNRAFFRDGWFYTGDLGYLDEEGYLYVLDRRKDLIISGGENIYPAEIEGVLKEHDAIFDVGVVGQEDEKWGQVPVAFIVLNKGWTITNEELNRFLKDKLARYKIPKKVYILEKLPRNAAKKLLRRTLLEWLEKGMVNNELT